MLTVQDVERMESIAKARRRALWRKAGSRTVLGHVAVWSAVGLILAGRSVVRAVRSR